MTVAESGDRAALGETTTVSAAAAVVAPPVEPRTRTCPGWSPIFPEPGTKKDDRVEASAIAAPFDAARLPLTSTTWFPEPEIVIVFELVV